MEESYKIDKLNGQSQWITWKFQIQIMLEANDCLDVVDGSFAKPEDTVSDYTTKIAEWKKKDIKAKKVIATSIGQQPTLHIMQCKNSCEMWNSLHGVYEQKSSVSIHHLQQRFYAFTRNETDDVATHISKIEELVKQLSDLGTEICDSMVISRILTTLPPQLYHFHSAWESTSKADQTLENLRMRLMNEESRMSKSVDCGDEALLAKRFDKKKYAKKNASQKGDKQKKEPGKCHVCYNGFHWRRDCPKLKEKEKEHALVSVCDSKKSDDWIFDSGATRHMINEKKNIESYSDYCEKVDITIGNGDVIEAHGEGDVHIQAFNGKTWQNKKLTKVYYVPNLHVNLFSAGTALNKGYTVFMNKKVCRVMNDDEIVIEGERKGKLYHMCLKVIPKSSNETAFVACKKEPLQLWHERLSHQNVAHVKDFLQRKGIQFNNDNFFCEACAYGKQHRLSFDTSQTKTERCGEMVHSDVSGQMPKPSVAGSRYFLLFRDDYSRYRVVYFMKHKSEVFELFKRYVKLVKNVTDCDLKILRSDNGTEYINSNMNKFLVESGIRHQKSVPYTPEQNGKSERDMRTIVEAARTMMHSKNMNENLWAEAVNTAVYVLNHTGTSTIEGKTPYELWFNKQPNVNNFKVFGIDVYIHIPKQLRRKWNAKSEKGIFLGYSDDTKGYRVLNLVKNRIEIARDVIFNEKGYDSIVNVSKSTNTSENEKEKENDDIWNDSILSESTINETVVETDAQNDSNTSLNSSNVSSASSVSNGSPNQSISSANGTSTSSTSYDTASDENGNTFRDGNQRDLWCDHNAQNVVNSRLRSQRNFFCAENLSETALIVQSSSMANDEPQNYDDAMNCDEKEKWIDAMREEHNSLMKNETWKLVKLPEGKKAIDNRWVYKIKHNPKGEIDRFKARLVIRGFTQEYGIDYNETFSPVVKFTSIRTILAIAAARNLKLKQFDVKTAFLYGTLNEEIYMCQPKGFNDESGRVCKLIKSLYGLKQASRCWNEKFSNFIKKFNFKQSEVDPCVFIQITSKCETYLAIYIDDGLIASNNNESIASIIEYLQKEFEIKVFEAECYLGLQIERRSNGAIFLHQENYAKKVLARFSMENCNSVTTPADPNQVLSSSEIKSTQYPYRQAVGSLMYLAVATRPDISYAVGIVSRFLEHPTEEHANAVKRIMRYIKGHITYGINFESVTNLPLSFCIYSDADYAGDIDSRKSTSGYMFMLSNGIISWASERQKSVALSTTESEYVAASTAIREMVWLQHLLKELQPNLYMDIGQ